MQEDDAPGLGDLMGRAIGIALIGNRKVTPVPGLVRCGTQDYLRRYYFRKSSLDLNSEFAGGSIGGTLERELVASMERRQPCDEGIPARAGFDRYGEGVEFAVVLDSFMPEK